MSPTSRSVSGLIAATVLTLAGCGGGGTTDPAAAPTTGTAPTTAAVESTPEPTPEPTAETPTPTGEPTTEAVDETGPNGTATEGTCSWISHEDIVAAFPELAGIPEEGRLVTGPAPQGLSGTIRSCTRLSEDMATGLRIHQFRFDDVADAQQWMDMSDSDAFVELSDLSGLGEQAIWFFGHGMAPVPPSIEAVMSREDATVTAMWKNSPADPAAGIPDNEEKLTELLKQFQASR